MTGNPIADSSSPATRSIASSESGYAAAHPEVVVAVMRSAASDFMALRISYSLDQIAAALLVEDAPSRSSAR